MDRIYLSPPHMSGLEREMLLEAFDSNWIAPLGPHVDSFEQEICEKVGVRHAAALSSGTAALHLSLVMLGVSAGDRVYCSSLTFSASVNAIVYVGATPVFIDSDRDTWTLDPNLLKEKLAEDSKMGVLPKALITVDIYGQSADYDRIIECCNEYNVPVLEDAAEALGATYRGGNAGTFGKMAILSFNGNKIITTSGGGMLLSDNEELINRARYLATQARDPSPHYEHSVIGYNYRMSNLLAAVGRGQLKVLDQRVAAKRRINQYYRKAISNVPGISFMPEAEYGQSNYWLTCILVDPSQFGADREIIRQHMESMNTEARPVWKPMHMQPVFKDCEIVGGEVSRFLFEYGLCLPCGTAMSDSDLKRVSDPLLSTPRTG